MKPNYTESKFIQSKSNDFLSCICYNCNQPFNILKKYVVYELIHKVGMVKYCSKKCKCESQNNKIFVNCLNCNKEFKKYLNQIKKSPNHFCSQSCAAIYRNTHKTKGYRRSKLEQFLEIELNKIYLNLEMLFNDKITINSELDIYIPSLKLAFELNGIFHYEPIYGNNKLNQIQNNDNRKFQACIEHGIELCLIDASKQKYFKEQSSRDFLLIITQIINEKLLS
jgi:hypothetical protein